MHSMLCCMCSVVTWRIHKEKKKVHHFPGKTANTSPRETTGALDTPEMCTGTPDRVKCTEMKVLGMAQTEESYKGKMEVFSLSNNIAYTSSANHKLELDTDPEYETITV